MLHWATPHMSVDSSNANAKKVQELASSFNCRNTSPESSSVRLVTACFDSAISVSINQTSCKYLGARLNDFFSVRESFFFLARA